MSSDAAYDHRPLLDRLGLPGVFDVHTHFLPPNVMAKVRAQFDQAGPLIGRPWPLHYRAPDDDLVQVLRGLGVRHFTALPYAHRPDMADWLNDWAAGFADRVPEALRCATFYPEPTAGEYVESRLAAGTDVFKVHVQVGGFDVREPLLEPVWAQVEQAGTPVVLHAGSGPVATDLTGPAPVAALLERHPDLALVIAHAGAPEYEEFLTLAERYPHVRLDTTMAFTSFFDELGAPFPARLLPRLGELGERGKVLFGSDFPNIPYPWPHQVEVLEALDLGDAWLRAVLWEASASLFDSPHRSPGA